MAGNPIDDTEWPDQLTAHVVKPGPDPRLHGYSVRADLARHYSFPEVALLALTGRLPTEDEGAAFSIALVWLSPISVAEAPSHAAVIAKICGGRNAQILATGAVGLTEQARFVCEAHASLLNWLADPALHFPAEAQSNGDTAQSEIADFIGLLPPSFRELPVFKHDPSLTAALLAVLHRCGLHSADQIEAAWALSRFASMAAESMAARVGDYRNYPTNTPIYVYREDSSEEA